MITLYATSESLYCAKLRILLRHKRVQWQETSPQGGCGSNAYRQLISTGTMPAIVHDGFVLTDSEAIAEYINEAFSTPAMLPDDLQARARCRERSRFHDTRLEPAIRALFPYVGKNLDANFIQSHCTLLNQRLEELSKVLEADKTRDSGFLSLADCGFPVSFAWLDAFAPVMKLDLKWPDSVTSYRYQIEQQSAVTEELSAYQPGMQAWMDSKLT